MITGDSVVTPKPGLVVETFPDGLLIWDEGRRRLHHLDSIAALVWCELDGRPLSDIAAFLATTFDEGTDSLSSDVVTFCTEMMTEGLLSMDLRTATHANGGEPTDS